MMRHPGLAMLTALAIALLAAVALLVDMASAQTATPTSTATATNTPTATANPATVSDQLISCWSLSEQQAITHPATGSSVRFDSWNANHLTDNNSTDSVGRGIIGGAAFFVPANSEYLSRPDNASISFSGNTDSFSISAWINTNDLSSRNTIVSKTTGSTSSSIEYFLRVNTDGSITFAMSDGTNLTSYLSAAGLISVGNIRHVVARYNPTASSGRYAIAVNGVVYASTTEAASNIRDGTADLCIGTYCVTGSNTNYLSGWIDEVLISDRALTDAEIAWLYNSGYGRSCAEIIGARGTPTPTPTTAPTITPNPALATVALSTQAALQLDRRITYGDMGTTIAIGLLGVLVVAYMLVRLQVSR